MESSVVENAGPSEGDLVGLEVVDMDGSSVGHIEQIYSHPGSTNSDWAAVASGLVDKKRIAVPLVDATIEDKVIVPYPKDMLVHAPELTGAELQETEETNAYLHYNLRRELSQDFRQDADLSDPPPQGALREAIATRAYELYEERGCADGMHEDDWLTAEREVRAGSTRGPAAGALTPDHGIE